jgi:Rap1a immunity proteins
MRYTILFFITLIVALAISSPGRAADRAPRMSDYCQALEKGTKKSGEHLRIPNTKEALLCWGYMQAMQDLSVLVTPEGQSLIGSCPPEQTTLLQLIHIFIAHERSNRRREEGNTAAAVIKALQDAFPCHQERSSVLMSPRQRQD